MRYFNRKSLVVLALVAVVITTAFAAVPTLRVTARLYLDQAGAVIYGNASIRGTATFERGALIDTVVNSAFASGDYIVVSFTHSNVTAADTTAAGPFVFVKEDTAFFKRTTAAYDTTSGNGGSYNYINLK